MSKRNQAGFTSLEIVKNRKKVSLRRSLTGFTILELMIATTIFSLMLMTASAMLVQIGRMYYKGVVIARTQGATRTITDDISRALQFSEGNVRRGTPVSPVSGVVIESLCIDNVRYSYSINKQVAPNEVRDDEFIAGGRDQNYLKHGLWRDETSGPCEPLNITKADPSEGGTRGSDGREMLAQGMRLTAFVPPASVGQGNLYSLRVGIMYGVDNEFFELAFDGSGNLTNAQCTNRPTGSQWCATSALDTRVYRRL